MRGYVVLGCAVVVPCLYGVHVMLPSVVTWSLITALIPVVLGLSIIMRSTVPAAGRTVLVTGCDSGFGFALAKRLDEKGFTVFAGCLFQNGQGAKQLQSDCSSRLHTIQLDVTSDTDAQQCLKLVDEHCGTKGLWGLVNNAGVVAYGDVELTTMEEYKRMVDINLFGLIRMTKTFLPLVRKAKGRIVNMSSLCGAVALPTYSSYAITKFGIEAFSDSLRLEVRPLGVKVIVVEPGSFGKATGVLNEFNRNRLQTSIKKLTEVASSEVKSVYGEDRLSSLLERSLRTLSTSNPNMDPVIDVIEEAIMLNYPPPRTLIDGSTRLIDIGCFLPRMRSHLPTPLSDMLVRYFHRLPELPSPNQTTN